MKHFLLAVAAATALASTSAEAGTVSITNVTGAWTSLTGGSYISGLTTNSVRWGENLGDGQSGYDFTGIAPSGPHAADTIFDMGQFTHINRPISSGTSITQAVLKVAFTFEISDDPGNLITRFSTFIFDHFETPNSANPCADGGANGVGVNENGCADRVTPITNPSFSETFEIGSLEYVFDVTGFDIGNSFWTRENAANAATMRGRFTLKENVSTVPLPAAGWLLVAGLAGLGAAARRRRG